MMPHRRLYQFICILFLFFAGGRVPLCAQQITQTLSWEEDPSILEYEVCIERLQSDGTYGEILRQKTEHSPLSVSLEPGIYRYVVFAFDLLGRIIPEAVWHKFEISSPSAEILSTAAVPVVYKGGDKNAMVFKTEAQNLAWNADSSVLEYEITIEQELESGEYTQIQKTRTERTHIQTAFSAGNYRYRITVYDLLGRGHVSDWISFSVLPQEQVIPVQPEVPSSVPLQPDPPLQMPEPVLITGFDVQSVQLWEQEELQTVLSVSGVQQESQAVLRDSRGVSYPVKICAADEASVTICAADTEIPNGTYTVYLGVQDSGYDEITPMGFGEGKTSRYTLTKTDDGITLDAQPATGIANAVVDTTADDGMAHVYTASGVEVYSAPASSFNINDVPMNGLLIIKKGGETTKVMKK